MGNIIGTKYTSYDYNREFKVTLSSLTETNEMSKYNTVAAEDAKQCYDSLDMNMHDVYNMLRGLDDDDDENSPILRVMCTLAPYAVEQCYSETYDCYAKKFKCRFPDESPEPPE